MYTLKRLSRDGVAAAMAKAERYRLLSQPWAAESITITDNAIIPLKERVVDQLFDPIGKLLRMIR